MQPSKLSQLLDFQLSNYPLDVCLAEKRGSEWHSWSTSEVRAMVDNLGCAILEMGLRPGDRVGIIAYNCPAWIITDLALLQIGIIDVPMYPNSTGEDYAYIINHAGIRVVFTGDAEIREKLRPLQDIQVIGFDTTEYEQMLHASSSRVNEVRQLEEAIEPGDVASIIYTSGTTGDPKGVMLTHSNIISNVLSLVSLITESGGKPGDRVLSFLPLSHIFERCGSYVDIYMSASVYFAESMETIGDNIREIHPHILRCVPRLLEKIYERIVNKGHALTGMKKKLFFWALDLANKYTLESDGSALYRLQLAVADKLILSKWREALGGEVKLIVSGAASLRASLVNVFWAAKIPIFEGYGLTETSPAVTISRPGKVRAGCVGVTLANVEIKIASDGEILVKGPNVMKGYYKDDEATREVLKDGWFHTGDIGEITADGMLKITDRKKEIFKTSGGKYIAPQPIEVRLKESMYIEQAMVIGAGRKFPAVLISPALDQVRSFLKRHNQEMNEDDLFVHEAVIQLFQREVEQVNAGFARFEQIKEFRLVPGEWSVESGLVTPKLSIKRREIIARYSAQIESIYGNT